MRLISLLIGISLVLLLSGCKKSPELATYSIPGFNSNVEANISIGKLTLRASFSGVNTADTQKFGFELIGDGGSKPVIYSVAKPVRTEIELKIDTAFRESANLKARAWIQVGSKKFYSEYTYFKGLGFPPPQIISLSKDYAICRELFYINGKYFTDNIGNNEIAVKIDNIPSTVVQASFDRIEVQMPDTKTKGKVKISLRVLDKYAAQEVEIENYRPEIYSVTPQTIDFKGEITIKGKFHSEYFKEIYPVQIDHSSFNIVKYTDDEIIIKSGDDMICDSIFYIYFNLPAASYNSEFLNTGFSVNRTGFWQRLNDLPFSIDYNYAIYGLTYNGKGFAIQFNVLGKPFLFWRYEPQSDTWTELPPFPGNYRFYPVFAECNGFIYCGMGHKYNYEMLQDFWKFDPVENKWTRCADLIFNNLNSYTYFGGNIENKIIVFSDLNTQKAEYDPADNSWEISNCLVPFSGNETKIFTYEGNYYSQCYGLIYLYDPTNNSFIFQYNDMDYSVAGPAFLHGNTLLTYGGCKIGELDLKNKRSFLRPDFANYFSEGKWTFNLFSINNVPYFFIGPNKLCKMNP